ncbi:MAG: hypothetical protein M3463_10645 [Verrucomicrobiota bacterium]|nr:hypothetical protein [Verrucomicrobiota bacterium]
MNLGSTRQEVISAFGEPDVQRSPGEKVLQYRDSIAITFDAAGKVSMIACGWWCFADTEEARAHPFRGRLQSGVRLGDEQKQVLKAFGTPTRRRLVSKEQAFESFSFSADGIVLSFKSGKLAHVMIEPPKKPNAESLDREALQRFGVPDRAMTSPLETNPSK